MHSFLEEKQRVLLQNYWMLIKIKVFPSALFLTLQISKAVVRHAEVSQRGG